MSNVVAFGKKEVEKTVSGMARCFGCRHEWTAVAPPGVMEFECPSCATMKGRYVYEFAPPQGTRWTCGCGSDLFYITKSGHMCANCGHEPDFS